jgi:macrolide transport system ATP-binding/permease protein
MIELKNITKTYYAGKIGVKALRGVSLKINPGEFVAIMGPSGSGKSTLLHTLGFLDRPDSGSYLLAGTEITKLTDEQLSIMRNRMAGFVFQQFHLLPNLNALKNVELPLIYAGTRHLKEKAHEKIKDVGLSSRETHRPNELSGGEKQRIAIARSLVNEPAIILADEPTGNLDTKSEEEIVSIFESLNRDGKTIILVTHEKEIAERAKRIIYMRDGRIISDERMKKETNTSISHPHSTSIPVEGIISESQKSGRGAELIDHFHQAVYAITSHRMRSVLSIMGILIGVAAVIGVLALGQGARESISQSLASLGSNLLTVMPGSRRMHGVALESGAVTRFTLQDADAIAKLSDKVSRVSPSVSGRVQLVYHNKNWNTQLQGTGADYQFMRASIPTVGRFFTKEESRVRKKVAVIGTTIARELFGDANPVGETVKINRINFQIIGILPEKGAGGMRDRDDVVIVPVTTAMYRLLGKDYVNSIDVEVKSPELIEETQTAIRQLISKRHHLNNNGEDSLQIRNMAEIQETRETMTNTMTWLLGSIAAISLLVGGIGIMNIMLVSVTERTREIGLRKAIGARKKDIMTQFLIEAVVLTFIGGSLGIVFGASIAAVLSTFAGWATSVSVFSILLAVIFSIGIGIAFGLWPARQGAALNPIEALRYE